MKRATLKQMTHATLIAAAFFLTGAGQTRGGPITGVTFHSSGGAPQWTDLSIPSTTSNLPDETGANSGISLSVSSTGTTLPFTVATDPSTVPTGDSNLNGLNGNFYDANTFTAVLSGLDAGATYNVWVFVTRSSFVTDQLVTITGAGTTSFSQIDSSFEQLILNSSIGSSARDFESYALPIVADGSGNITIQITNEDGDLGAAFSGIAIQEVTISTPEPATLGLLACGTGCLAACGWRRRKPVAA